MQSFPSVQDSIVWKKLSHCLSDNIAISPDKKDRLKFVFFHQVIERHQRFAVKKVIQQISLSQPATLVWHSSQWRNPSPRALRLAKGQYESGRQ
jgi:hypothetical protein